jgi:hypothetical protein
MLSCEDHNAALLCRGPEIGLNHVDGILLLFAEVSW